MLYNILDLFCGCGGLSCGFSKAGFNTVLGVDHWDTAIQTYKKNHKESHALCANLETLTPKEIESHLSKYKIHGIVGGPPCQGFSISGKRDPKDTRNRLYKNFIDNIVYFKPKFFVMENVPNLLSMSKGLIKDQIIKDLEGAGYKVFYQILTASDFGVPQNRKRVFFVGFKDKNVNFQFMPTEYEKNKITSKDAISDLGEHSLEDGSEYLNQPSSDYQRLMRNDSLGVFNHNTTKHTEKTVKIIGLVPDGGNYKNLPEHLKDTRKVNIAWTRLNSLKPSFTIDTGHRHHFHYKYNRIPTVREAARLQSFPDNFIFEGAMTAQHKQVGNAVPPLLAQRLAEEISKYLN